MIAGTLRLPVRVSFHEPSNPQADLMVTEEVSALAETQSQVFTSLMAGSGRLAAWPPAAPSPSTGVR
ncbi:hypothetical protein [Phenylobacterium sp.]|uniref:hypothetical protein n=1 Tax=Phenylobacterium sp. TaxID=1871053 RepID=UPI0039831406